MTSIEYSLAFPGSNGHEQLESETAEKFISWAITHAGGQVGILPHDPVKYPFQALEIVHVKPNPNLEIAHMIGAQAMGQSAYERLISDLRQLGIIEDARSRAAEGLNSLVATGHLKSIQDTAISHNAWFVASGDPTIADQNVIIANQMMKYMTIGPYPLVDILSASGHLVMGIPDIAGKGVHGILPNLVDSTNRATSKVVIELMRKGVVFHRALTDTRSKRITLDGGAEARMLPRLTDDTTASVVKRMNRIYGIPMSLESGRQASTVMHHIVKETNTKHPYYDVRNGDEVHDFMQDMAVGLGQLTGENVVYGLPEGAHLTQS